MSSIAGPEWIAALPMYDWPEMRAETDAQWAGLCTALRSCGIDAPCDLVRRNADLPPVPGGIRDGAGAIIAPDPASLPPDELDLRTLWLHPALLFAQACWGPMQLGLEDYVSVVGQPDYSAFEGGEGEFYSSVIVTRLGMDLYGGATSATGGPTLPLKLLCGKRLAYNSTDSMSGILAIAQDLEAIDANLTIFSAQIETRSHRGSIRAVAEGEADVAAIDCKSWALAKRFESSAAGLVVVGWTKPRKGLPFIAGRGVPEKARLILCEALHRLGMTIGTGPVD